MWIELAKTIMVNKLICLMNIYCIFFLVANHKIIPKVFKTKIMYVSIPEVLC